MAPRGQIRRWPNQPCVRRSRNCAEASALLDGLPETRERKQLELDIHVTLTAALMAGKGYADPEVVAALERANRLVTETASVGTPLHFSVLFGLWVLTTDAGHLRPRSSTPTNFLSSAQSQPSSGPLLVGHRTLACSLMSSGDSPCSPRAFRNGRVVVSARRARAIPPLTTGRTSGSAPLSPQLSWLWHRGYPDQSARAADRALAYSRDWDMPTPLPTPFSLPAWPRSSPEMSPPSTPAGNDCVALASEHGFAHWAALRPDSPGLGRRPKGEATTGIAAYPRRFGRSARRPAPAYTHRSSSPCWPRRWRWPEK